MSLTQIHGSDSMTRNNMQKLRSSAGDNLSAQHCIQKMDVVSPSDYPLNNTTHPVLYPHFICVTDLSVSLFI